MIKNFPSRGKTLKGNFFISLPLCTGNILYIFFRNLDLSFNLMKTVENLGCLTKLKKLFLVSNKISKIEGLQDLMQLEMVELGANKIRVSIKTMIWINEIVITRLLNIPSICFTLDKVLEGFEGLTQVHSLFVGKNKITKLEVSVFLPATVKFLLFALNFREQVERILKWDWLKDSLLM